MSYLSKSKLVSLQKRISESHSVVTNSLWLHELYSPWNSPGQNTGVGAYPFSRGSSQPRNRIRLSCTAGGFFTNWAIKQAQYTQKHIFLSAVSNEFWQMYTLLSALLTMPKPLTVWITINCGKFFKRWEYQTTWPASWEIYMQVRKQQLELDMEQQTGSK